MRIHAIGFTAMTLAISASAASAQGRMGRAVVDTLANGAVRTSSSGPTGWAGSNGWRLVLERVVQPADESAGSFGNPYAVQLLTDGRLLVADQKPVSLKLYSATGRFERLLGREGAGPGEYRAPQAVLFRDSVFIHDHQLARGTVMDLTGKVARSFPTACCIRFAPVAVDDRGQVRLMGPSPKARAQWLLFSARGARLDSAPPFEVTSPLTWVLPRATIVVPLSPENRTLVLKSGEYVYGSTDRYQFWVSRSGRDTVRTFGRTDVAAEHVPTALRDSLFEARTANDASLRAVASRGDVPGVFPMWKEMAEDGNGNLWILAGVDGGRAARLDVFAPDGRFLGSVASPVKSLARVAWSRDRMAAIDVDDADLPLVRIYRIVKLGQ